MDGLGDNTDDHILNLDEEEPSQEAEDVEMDNENSRDEPENPNEDPFVEKSRKRAPWWDDLIRIESEQKAQCKYCNIKLSCRKNGPTTHLSRHIYETCPIRPNHMKKQSKINFLPVDSCSGGSTNSIIPLLHDGKFDMLRMREVAAHWILMHEHPFSILEEEGYNLMMKRARPEWTKISRITGKVDCFKVYDQERKKLKTLLGKVGRMCLTTDLWEATPQKMEYMVITGHFVDSNWKLQKRVLNFFHLPPPRKGVQLSNAIYKCLQDWNIENKVIILGRSFIYLFMFFSSCFTLI